jgi:hypothetical protein
MRIFTVSFAILFLIGSAVSGEYAGADNANKAAPPILVELFTSEGCSSCPPADALLQQLDASQPVSGAQIIVLSEHVDYWDHDGWKDPHSSHFLTDRQESYIKALGLATAYTPQLIVDGSAELRGDLEQLNRTFKEALSAPKFAVHIGSVTFEGAPTPTVRAHIDADGLSAKHGGDVFVALAIDQVQSQVLRGENSGRNLKHVAVVQSLTKIGKLEKGKAFDRDFALKLPPGMQPTNIRVVAFVQEPGPGKVLAGTMWKSTN